MERLRISIRAAMRRIENGQSLPGVELSEEARDRLRRLVDAHRG